MVLSMYVRMGDAQIIYPRGVPVTLATYWASVNIEAVQGHIFKRLYVISCLSRLLLSSLTPFDVFPIRKESFRTSRTNSNLRVY